MDALSVFFPVLGIWAILLFFMFGIAVTAFWIWMLVDCAQRTFPPQDQNTKVLWILIIVFTHWIGALIYYFVVKCGPTQSPPNVPPTFPTIPTAPAL